VALYTTVQKRILGINFIWGIMVSAISKDKIFQAQQEITDVLRIRHRLQPWDYNDFTVRNQTDIAETATATSKIMTILLGSIASVSLIVGGIGIILGVSGSSLISKFAGWPIFFDGSWRLFRILSCAQSCKYESDRCFKIRVGRNSLFTFS
jgi:hypothetical protein